LGNLFISFALKRLRHKIILEILKKLIHSEKDSKKLIFYAFLVLKSTVMNEKKKDFNSKDNYISISSRILYEFLCCELEIILIALFNTKDKERNFSKEKT
jgi:hypothetical protein